MVLFTGLVPVKKFDEKQFCPMALDSILYSGVHYKSILFDVDFHLVLPEIFLIIAVLFLLVYGVLFTTSHSKNYPILLGNLSVLTLLTLAYTFLLIINNPVTNAVLFYNTFFLDDFAVFSKLLIVLSSFAALAISLNSFQQESINAFECIILLALSTLSMLLLVASADFISMYLAIELQSLSFYVIAAIKRNSEFSTEAGLKYFLLGAFSSGLLLFGCSLIYGFTGVTNFSDLAKIFAGGPQEILSSTSSLPAFELGMVFLLVGFLFKLAAAPFHMWSPDVYEGAPTAITAYFMITPKAAILAIFMRLFLECFYDFFPVWQSLLIVASFASLGIASIAALSQTKIKRLLAFSSIGHVGFLLAGFACGTLEGIQAVLIYLVIYITMNITIFSFLLCTLRIQDTATPTSFKYISDLSYLSKVNPGAAAALTVTLFSMAGIPPLAGFYSKVYLFFATVSSGLYSLALFGVLASVVSCFYYIRVIKIMYFQVPTKWCSFLEVPYANALTLSITTFFLVLVMIYPSPLHLVTHKVSLILCS